MKTLRLSANDYLIFQHQRQLDSNLQSQVAKIKKIIFFLKFKKNIFYSLYTHQNIHICSATCQDAQSF